MGTTELCVTGKGCKETRWAQGPNLVGMLFKVIGFGKGLAGGLGAWGLSFRR